MSDKPHRGQRAFTSELVAAAGARDTVLESEVQSTQVDASTLLSRTDEPRLQQPRGRVSLAKRMENARDAIAGFAPDYVGNTWRVWLLVVGSAIALLSWHTLLVLRDTSLPASMGWMMIAVAVIARIFPVEIRGARSDHVVSDSVIAVIALLHGAPLATLAVAAAVSVESHMRTKRHTVQLFNASLSALTLYTLLQVMEAGLTVLAMRFHEPMMLIGVRAVAVVAVLMLHLSAYKALQQLFYISKARSLGGTVRPARGLLRVNGADGASGALAATLYLLVCMLSLKPLGQLTLFFITLMVTMPLHSRQRSASLQIQRLRMASIELAAREANSSLQRVRVNEARFFSAFEDAAIGMCIIDPDGRILIANRALKALLREPHLVSKDVRRFVHREDVSVLAARLNALVASVVAPQEMPAAGAAAERTSGEHKGAEADLESNLDLRCVTKDEEVVVVTLHAGVFREPERGTASRAKRRDSANGLRLIVQMQDVTRMHMANARMVQYAYFDGLTRLCNRVFFQGYLKRALHEARSDPSKSFAVMYLDFDRFKQINDQHGHGAGDEFLVLIAERLRNGVRPGDVVSRLGGDEFAILVPGADSTESVMSLGNRILASLREPYNLVVHGVTVRSSASIGVAIYSDEHADDSSMMRAADSAMYRAKANGRDRIVIFGPDLRAELDERLMIERDLRPAIEGDRLELAFQPIFRLDTGHVISLEALLRWTHPKLGVISPQRLVQVAEEAGMMGELTQWVIRAACMQSKLLSRGGYSDISVHVNVSGSDVGRPDFVSGVEAAVKSARINPKQLVVEITESTLMQQLAQCGKALETIGAMGVGISIDDFGTGYSSLAYLGQLPFNSLKIDRSFVCSLETPGRSTEVVRLIVAMASALDKKVIAEGIETEEQALRLRDLGCCFGQGYFVSKPIAASGLMDWLRKRQPPATTPGEMTQPMRQVSGLPCLDAELDLPVPVPHVPVPRKTELVGS